MLFEEHDVLLTPTLSRPPIKTGSLLPPPMEVTIRRWVVRANSGALINSLSRLEKLSEQEFSFSPYTAVFNATGQPAMSLPLWWNVEGLPIGMQFVGRYGDEATLFRLAGQLERARPWFERRPPICG
jgi:amidase